MTSRGDEDRPTDRRSRRSTLVSLGGTLALLGVATAATVSVHPMWRRASADIEVPGVMVPAPSTPLSPIRLEGALVRGAARDWAVGRKRALRIGEPVPVQLTAYCLQGTTRRDQRVREGIVAADPKLFPLGRYIEVYIGRKYHGRFLVDDTGSRIRDGVLDIWTPSCREARRFGRQRGTAVLVPRPRGAHKDTLLTGRLGGLASR
ncbi:MAG: 3D domain-containing protein [Gemmatimonadaceae bacterium]